MVGSYDASTGTWRNGATYSLARNGNNFTVTGTIPYGQADAMFGAAGNRFAVRVYNTGVDERTDLPTGIIVKTTNKNVPSGYNNGTRADFESDGSLIAVFAPTAENKDTYDREIKIKWKAGEEFTVYTFDLSGATLQQAYNITTTVTNGTKSGDTQILSGSTASVTIAANNGYDLPENVTVTGATVSYNATTGVISLSNPTGNVTISATCEEEPVAGLTPFAANDVVTGIRFDTSLSTEQVTSIVSGLDFTDGYEEGWGLFVDLIKASDNSAKLSVARMDMGGSYAYAIAAYSSTEGHGVYVWASQTVGEYVTEGFQNLTDGSITSSFTVAADGIYQGSAWNGIIAGKE